MNLRDMTILEMTSHLARIQQPVYRARQLYQWVHQKGISNYDDIKNMPKELLLQLQELTAIGLLSIQDKQISGDGTIKYLWELADGNLIESVLLRDADRQTACISSQVGCKMACTFCATGQLGLRRNLSAGEIVSQIYQMESESGQRISNVVYMGMGEPLDNYDQVIKSITILNSEQGKNIGQRKMTVSTCGLIPEIKKLSNEKLQITLAVSLNSASDDVRSKLMPVNKKYQLTKLIEALLDYKEKVGRRISIEYVLLAGINDTDQDAALLGSLLKELSPHINLISFNDYQQSIDRSSNIDRVKSFRRYLENAGYAVTQRFRRGIDIQAACGQLSASRQQDSKSS